MEILTPIVRELLEEALKEIGPEQTRKKMQKAVPSIVAGMKAKGMVPGAATLDILVRDALFRLWKVVVRWGDIADKIRDTQEAKVYAQALPLIKDRGDLKSIVNGTLEAAMAVTF